jgi:thiol:disulfide interchange protein DsbC
VRGGAALIVVCGVLVTAAARGDEPSAPGLTKAELAERYASSGLRQEHIGDAPVRGLYEIAIDMGVSYLTTDGRYLFRGEIIDVETKQNLTERKLDEMRAELFGNVDPASEIIFGPQTGAPTYRVYVLTDVDCGYCRQFHRDIAGATALGVEVHYLAYPRTGPDSASWVKAEGVWCAADRKAALTRAKLGGEVQPVEGCVSPVAEHYALGRAIKVPGTPGIYTEWGADVGGYFPPEQLVSRLQQLAAQRSTDGN